MRFTHEQVLELIKPGDVILVHYMQAGIVSAGIQFASGGSVSHALCCLGGMEIVEADIGGVMHTYLDNYLTGKCRLTIKRLHPELTQVEAHKVCDYWRSCISQPYDFGMIVHAAVVSPIRRLIMPICPPLGRLILRILSKFTLANHQLSTCAELAARGLRLARPKFMRSYDAEEITPAAMLTDATTLDTVRVLDEPILVGGPVMLGFSPDAWGAIGTIAGTIGVGASAIYARMAASERRAHELEMDQIKKDFDRVDASLKASWVILDDLRFNAVRRQDQDKMREELRRDMETLGNRLEAAITSLRSDIHRGKAAEGE